MSRPTMDRAIEAIERGDLEAARALCEEMKHEWRLLHDLMVGGMAGLISFVQARLGDDGVEEAWTYSLERGWKGHAEAISRQDRRWMVRALAANWRAHSCSGTGPHPGAFTIAEDDEKFTFAMNPCGSGQRLWRMGAYEGPDGLGVTERGARLELRPRGLPALLHALHVHERAAADPLDRPSRSTPATRPRTSTAIRAPGTGTRTPPTSRPALGAVRARSRRVAGRGSAVRVCSGELTRRSARHTCEFRRDGDHG